MRGFAAFQYISHKVLRWLSPFFMIVAFSAVGAGVGVKIRFHDKSTADSWVKLMTDGILLAEIQRDRRLLRYDTLIIDEAHERSLNIDFILGYLRQLLPKRPDLKIIVTSATIDTGRFARHFEGHASVPGTDARPSVPVIEVTGRTYPVEVRYRPIETGDQVQAIGEAIAPVIDLVDLVLSVLQVLHGLDDVASGKDELAIGELHRTVRRREVRARVDLRSAGAADDELSHVLGHRVRVELLEVVPDRRIL